METDSNVTIQDADASYDPASGISLDEHRQQVFATMTQTPFGTPQPPKAE